MAYLAWTAPEENAWAGRLGLGLSTFVAGGAIELTGSIAAGWRLNALVSLACLVLLLFARVALGLQTPVRAVARAMCERMRAHVFKEA
ncbi:hypothetical protein KFE25_010481 [Diacronema lutheri]|uniref:Uncharacterized protein n=1 Tax=Diacronema lutheri TaxID=2081491 RepID=A0A8J5XBU5_DIALT|nr:hypothetical protein KFE25_010481 [Diacronema lutheri]